MKKDKLSNDFIALRVQGESLDSICSKLGIAKQTAIDWNRENKNIVENEKAILKEKIFFEVGQNSMSRIKKLSSLLEKIEKEIESRELRSCSLKELMDSRRALLEELEVFKPELTTPHHNVDLLGELNRVEKLKM